MEKDLLKRKTVRLQEFDYNTPGAYFITFCTYNKAKILSHVVGAIHESPVSELTSCGQIVEQIIKNIPPHLHATIDRYVIMPNHVHLIIELKNDWLLRAIRESPLHSRSVIAKTVGYIKMNASKAIRQQLGDITVWQRSYYDHIIRNQDDYNMIAKYISENPIRWREDKFYTE